jgi:hypothetical protein
LSTAPRSRTKTAEQPPDEPVAEAVARPERKIAIIGYTASRHLAPWGQEGWEMWPCNNLPLHLLPGQEWHRLYDLHDHDTIVSDKAHEAFLRGETVKSVQDGRDVNIGDRKVVVWKPREEWPNAVAYPKDGVLETFSNLSGGRYFSNSISWMIAHAICEAATEIHVYGVDMAQSGEYSAQRPSCEYWLGFAEALGIKVHIPDTSDLLKCAFLYGVDDDGPISAKMADRAKELKGRLDAVVQQQTMLQNQQQQLRDAQMQMAGALEDVSYWRGTWMNARANRDGSAKDSEAPDAPVNGG